MLFQNFGKTKMNEVKVRLYRWAGILWNINSVFNEHVDFDALCPKNDCRCKLREGEISFNRLSYIYYCFKCGFTIILSSSIEEKAKDLADILESKKFSDAEIINIDGELVKVQRKQIKDADYWIDVKISKNKKEEVQLMVLAGSKKEKDKTQLFVDPKNERLSFDQNDDHPRKIFSKVIAIFKETKVEIKSK